MIYKYEKYLIYENAQNILKYKLKYSKKLTSEHG